MIIASYSAFRTVFATSATLDLAGYPVWPVDKLRINGFAEITGVPRPVTLFPFQVTCNGNASDGGAAFDWYLSQRTDVQAKQFLRLTSPDPLKSGTINFGLTGLAHTSLGISLFVQAITEDNLVRLFRDVTIYCQRRSDKSIQLIQLLPYTLGTG